MSSAHEHFVELAAAVPDVRRVLDLPAGDGNISRRLKDRRYDVTAADINPATFEPKDMTCGTADLNSRLPYGDGEFDLIVCREGIEHVENQFHTVREFRRVLKPGGWFLLSTPNMLSIRARLAMLLVAGRDMKDRPPHDHISYTAGDHINLKSYLDLRAVLRRIGFRIESVTTHRYSVTSLLWCWLVPLMALFSWRAYVREKDPAQREANREIWRHMFSRAILFGQKLIILARSEPAEPPR